jgi:anaerobic selenocysteine-containing dehydrogenase
MREHDSTSARSPLNSKCIVIWGTNKFESSVHSKRVIQEAIENGAKLIVIDPRKTPHAEMADIYTTIRPGTDGALALGIANEIISRGLYDRGFVKNHVHGFEGFKERVAAYDKMTVSDITWVDVNTIEEIAITFATHGPALIMTAPAGMNHYTNGTWAARAVHSLLAICGYLGISGGGFQYLSSDNSPFNSKAVTLEHLLNSSVQPVVPSGTYIPEYVLSQEESPLDVLVIQAANPLTQWPNTNKARAALEKIPFKVCIDLELTDTARLCEIVLPATFIFEHDNLVHSELHRIVQFASKIVEPEGNAKDELDIWKGIAGRLSMDEHFELTPRDAMRLALDSKECRHITLEGLMEHPEGIRTTAPVIPFSDRSFKTSTKKVELYSTELEALGHDPLPFYEEPAESPISTPDVFEEFPLIMITGRLRERLHSQYTTVELGADVKSFAHCTTCQECIKKCPDEAITLAQPSVQQIQMNDEVESIPKAKLREQLSSLVGGLAVRLSNHEIPIPESITGLLVPLWNEKACIGCRECNLDDCPYDVVEEPIRMPSMQTVPHKRTFLRMHPDTATNLGLANGDRVTIESRRGRVTGIILEVTEEVDPRLVWSSDGWWERDGNINVLTDDKHTAYGHTPGFNSVLVKVYLSE